MLKVKSRPRKSQIQSFKPPLAQGVAASKSPA